MPSGMEITTEQFRRVELFLPVQRGNVSISNLQVANAILYVTDHGCQRQGLPACFGDWHTIYIRTNSWARGSALDRVFEEMQHQQLIRIKIEAVALDITRVEVHPNSTGAQKKEPQEIGKSRGGWTIKIHMIAAYARSVVTSSLLPGQAHDAPPGQEFLRTLERAAARRPGHHRTLV